MERTTDINKLRGGHPFTWGATIKIYEVREYSILEYHPWKTTGCTVNTGDADDIVSYHVWVNDRDTARSCESLDEALACAIAYKCDGANSQAARFFIKMISQD